MATGSTNVDAAINFLITPADDRPALGHAAAGPVLGTPTGGALFQHPDGAIAPAHRLSSPSKLVLVVNSALGMSAGKVAAQCVHAALGIYRAIAHHGWCAEWELSGEKTVTLSGGSSAALEALEAAARAVPLPVFRLHDAGRTEVEPGAFTVLAIAGPEEEVNTITGTLRTY